MPREPLTVVFCLPGSSFSGRFQRLLSHDRDIVSGLYLMEGGGAYATVKKWDEQFFLAHGHFPFLTHENLTPNEQLLEVPYTGMGFMLVKHGVVEKLEYPWFRPVEKWIGDMVDFTMEDVAFCLRAREAGFEVWVDTGVRVGHEKGTIL